MELSGLHCDLQPWAASIVKANMFISIRLLTPAFFLIGSRFHGSFGGHSLACNLYGRTHRAWWMAQISQGWCLAALKVVDSWCTIPQFERWTHYSALFNAIQYFLNRDVRITNHYVNKQLRKTGWFKPDSRLHRTESRWERGHRPHTWGVWIYHSNHPLQAARRVSKHNG